MMAAIMTIAFVLYGHFLDRRVRKLAGKADIMVRLEMYTGGRVKATPSRGPKALFSQTMIANTTCASPPRQFGKLPARGVSWPIQCDLDLPGLASVRVVCAAVGIDRNYFLDRRNV